jgi:CRISPR-associated endonuclease Cas2
MRSTYLVCYDVADDKRLRKVFKTMRDFGDHLQYSIFECQFTPIARNSRCKPLCSATTATAATKRWFIT